MLSPQIVWLVLFSVIGIVLGGALFYLRRQAGLSITVAAISIALGVLIMMIWPEMPDTTENSPVTSNPNAEEPRAPKATLAVFEPYRPIEIPTGGYTASDACRECHQDQHQSWHASYHRTMTQVATPDAVLGDFDQRKVIARGRPYILSRMDDICTVEMYNPDLPASKESEVKVPILMTTGSHHMQVYWYPGGEGRTLAQLPIVYLRETDEWVPKSATFLKPPNAPVESQTGIWNVSCSKCHSTHRREMPAGGGTYRTQVTEFGISCEACHGPGDTHIEYHRGDSKSGVDPIVNPSSLTHQRSTEVCGQCHSVHSNHEADVRAVATQGHSFRPGDEYAKTHHLWSQDSPVLKEFLASLKVSKGEAEEMRSVFWDDGMIRVAGREFNGLSESACYIQGEMSCISCHAMHQSPEDHRPAKQWADDQLSPMALGDASCTQCHAKESYGTAHTHHAESSSGSRCYNCHMPHTTYGLMKAIRSHTITSPNVSRDREARRPNACNLCHLDRTLAWTDQTMSEWYGTDLAELNPEEQETAASVLWMLQGDAGLRALAAWHMGWKTAQEVSGRDWLPAFLIEGLQDPYDAVRFISRRSLQTFATFADEDIQPLAPEPERNKLAKRLQRDWTDQVKRSDAPELLLNASGIDSQRYQKLLQQRDTREVSLIE